jgi:hypothetical protein
MLEDALRRDTRLTHTYRRSEALILTDLADLEEGRTPARLTPRWAWSLPGRCRTCSNGCSPSKRCAKRHRDKPLP